MTHIAAIRIRSADMKQILDDPDWNKLDKCKNMKEYNRLLVEAARSKGMKISVLYC